MSTNNPHFGHIDGAPYEIPNLLKLLGDVRVGERLSKDRLDMVDAIVTHSRNANELILDGLQSIGHLMTLTGCGELELVNGHVAQLGTLIKHLAVEANFLRATHNDMQGILAEQANKEKK